MRKNDNRITIAAITRAVNISSRYSWPVIVGFLLVTIVSVGYLVRHFAITTDSNKLLSSSLPWRQQEIMLDRAFPQRIDQIIAVIDATTPEAAGEAADALVKDLSSCSDVIRTVTQPDGGEFFARNGILFLTTDEVRRNTAELIAAQPFLGTLASDPTLRGVLRTLSQSIEGIGLGKSKLEDLRPALVAIADALEFIAKGKDPAFSWRRLITGRAPEPSELRRFVNIQPVLDFDDLQPGRKATTVIRETASRLGLTPERGVTIRLTGSVALSDEEFSTVADGAALNGVVTLLLVVFVLWLALKRARIILAVLVSLVIGLTVTAAVGLWMVGALNLISVAFAVLFVGLGVDFGIQFSVRYRAERHASLDLHDGLLATARGLAGLSPRSRLDHGRVLLVPADRISGPLRARADRRNWHHCRVRNHSNPAPALLTVLKPTGEAAPIGYAALAPLDRFLEQRRKWVVGTTLAATIFGLPLLAGLRFDFNPLNLRAQDAELISTLLDLMRDPDTSPNTLDILESNFAHATSIAERLRAMPEVARVLTLQSFVPKDQDAKLAIIDDASFFLREHSQSDEIDAEPTPAETVVAIEKTAYDLGNAAGYLDSPAAVQARRLAGLLAALAKAPPEVRDKAQHALIAPLITILRQVRDLLTAEHVSIENSSPLAAGALDID